MSSLSANLCLFSAALCNVAVLDSNIFETQGNQQQFGNTGFIDQATGLLGLGGYGIGGFNGGQQQQQNRQKRKQNKQRTPHQSPCAKKFQYVTDGREWKGLLKLKNIELNRDTLLEADFVLPQGLQQRSYQGKIDIVNQDVYDDVANGLPLIFDIAFASQNPVPKLIALYKNKREICAGPLESLNGLRTFRLNFLVKAPASFGGNVDDLVVVPEIMQKQPHAEQFIPPQDDDSVCGIQVVGFTQSLVIGGQPSGHGEWPWLVAFYRSSKGNLEFICGSSLISKNYVITAAHCIQDKGQTEPMATKDALLFIGKHNLIEWNEEGYEKKGAKSFKLHPEWNPSITKYDADIALIEMDSPVQYTKFIRPICMWTGAPEIDQVVGQNGIVAGWGKNDDGQLNTDFPKKVNVPIVSDSTCLRTHEAFFHITSDRTFCAGGKMGEGPCQGDSGGGLMLKIGKKWVLRGIVSASLRDITANTCDVNNYAVFTDIAKFIPWIRSQTSAL